MTTSKIAKYEFKIRAHDLDSSGLTSPSGLCRILETSRWYSLMPGGTLQKNVQRGVVRAQHIEILEQVSFGRKIEVATWISRIGGTSFDIGSWIKSSDNDAIIARSAVTFVSLDGQGKPCLIDKAMHEMIADQDTVGVPRIHRELEEDAWSTTVEVRKSDEDLLQHMNQARYIDYIGDARFSCVRLNGYKDKTEAAKGKVNRFTISYDQQVYVGDLLQIYTWAVNDTSNQLAFEIRREGDNAAIAHAEMSVA